MSAQPTDVRGSQGSLIECRDLTRTFLVSKSSFARKSELTAVQGVNLEVRSGEVLGIVGESGCGKSTLAKMLLGIHRPTRGEIVFDGMPLEKIDRRELGRRVQPVFQDPYTSLNPRKRVSQVIGLPLVVHKKGGRERRRHRVEELMELCGLPHSLYHSYPGQLSGGQRQRVAIARALAAEPAVVICDEPTSALDVSVQAQILNLLERLKRELGLTYVLISHDLAVIEHICDRVAVMYLGRLVELGATERVFQRPLHPYTRALLDSNLGLEPGRGFGSVHLRGGVPDPLNPPSGCSFHPRCTQARSECALLRPPAIMQNGDFVECVLAAGEHD